MGLRAVLHINTISISLSLAAGLQGLQMRLHLPLLDLQDHRAQVQPRLFHHLQARHLPEPRLDPQDLRDLCPDPLLGLKLRHLRWELDHQFHPRRLLCLLLILLPPIFPTLHLTNRPADL
jgi:hypothetical protein